jgi:hypothetical protein
MDAVGSSAPILVSSSDEHIHLCLLALAEKGNSSTSIAARQQSHPSRIGSLLGLTDPTTLTATGGSAYNFHTRPFQYSRSRSIRMDRFQTAAVSEELSHLRHVYQAVETAPAHDGDKAILPSAPAWEHRPLRVDPWPGERRVPVFSTQARIALNNRKCTAHQHRRRAARLAFRDFESPVFIVPIKDGAFRLCTDYHKLNVFQRKTTFKMDDVQLISEIILPGDYGTLLDLKDAYLTLGLHPAHRKYCRFRDPSTGQSLQWRTVSFGIAEAPRICTKLLRPLIALLKQVGIRCMIYIDDILLLHQDRLQLARIMVVTLKLLQLQAGLNVKTTKYNFHPSQRFQCLGYVSLDMKVRVPLKRLKETHRMAKRLLRLLVSLKDPTTLPTLKTRVLACFVGKVVATFRGIRGARRHLLYLQHALGQAVR